MTYVTQHDLRLACQELHSLAEKTQLAQDLINGTIDPYTYTGYCYQLFLIADAIENKFTFENKFLYRRYEFIKDLTECPPAEAIVCTSTDAYLSSLNELEPRLLKGHIYTHYLGWLYGGQIIAKNLKELPKHHLTFLDQQGCIDEIRSKILIEITSDDVEQAKSAFSNSIGIYTELYDMYRID